MKTRKPVGIGIAGYGGFGVFLHKSWSTMSEARVTAVCDEDPSRRPDPALAAPAFYRLYAEMLSDPTVDLVCVATPPSSHAPMALEAIAAGKHVLVEKPFAISAAEGKRIVEAASRSGLVVTVDFMLRYDPLVDSLRQLVAAEVFGKLRRIDLRNYAQQQGVPEGHWFWDKDVCGGILIEHAVHFFDLATYVNRSPAKRVTGAAVERKPGMEDRVFACVTYENGVVGTYWHSFSRPQPLERTTMHFAFDLGEVGISGWVPLEAEFWGWTGDAGLDTLGRLFAGAEISAQKRERESVRSSDEVYDVTTSVEGRYALPQPKLDVYADCLRDIMGDMVRAIGDPSHRLRVTAEDGIEAVDVAERATEAARGE